jgi:TonB family protein
MYTRSHHSASSLTEQRNRRKQRAKRRKQMAAGIPTSVPLKPITISPEQQQAISIVRAKSYVKHEPPMVTPKRMAWLISLGFHLIAAFLATLYVIKTPRVDDDAINVEIMHIKEAHKNRRSLPRKRVEVPKPTRLTQVKTPQALRPVTTAVDLPESDLGFTLPGDELSKVDVRDISDDAGIDASGLERKLLKGTHRAKIDSEPPDIRPEKNIDSMIAKFDPVIPQDPLKLEAVEPPPAELKEAIKAPRFLQKADPKYPDRARRAQKEGVVWLEATIGVDGTAKDITVTEGIGFGCDEAAIDALKNSRFVPAKQGEESVAVRIQISYRFKLED